MTLAFVCAILIMIFTNKSLLSLALFTFGVTMLGILSALYEKQTIKNLHTKENILNSYGVFNSKNI